MIVMGSRRIEVAKYHNSMKISTRMLITLNIYACINLINIRYLIRNFSSIICFRYLPILTTF